MKPWEKYQTTETKPWEKYQSLQVTEPKEEGFFSGVRSDLKKRGEQLKVSREATAAGKQTPLEREVQEIGTVLGGAGDIVGRGIGAAAKGIYSALPERVQKDFRDAGEELKSTKPVQAGLEMLGSGMEKYQKFSQENPRAARNIEALANIGLAVAPAIGRGKQIGESAEGIGQGIISKFAKPEKLNSEDLRRVGGQLFKEAEAKGGILKPHVTNKFIAEISQKAPQTYAGRIIAGNDEVTNLLDRVQDLADRPLTLEAAKEVDETLGDLAYKNMDMGKFTAEGKKFLDMRSSFRRIIEDAADNDVVGGKSGFDVLKEARKYWSTSLRLRDIERIIERAQNMQVPATGIKTGFRNLIANKNALKGYSPQEIDAIRKAAKTGIITDLMAVFGSRLNPIITGSAVSIGTANPLMGIAAGVGNYATSSMARGLATASQLKKARFVEDLIRRRVQKSATQSVKLTPEILGFMKEIGISQMPAGGVSELLNMLEQMQKENNVPQGNN